MHFFCHESEAGEGKFLIRSKTKCFILSLSFFTQFCSEGVAHVQILAGQVPASTERSNPNVSFQPRHGAAAGADEVSRRGWARFGESSAGDRLPWDGSSPAKPRAQEQGQDSGRDVQEGSLPSWQRSPRSGVTPEPPLCPQGPAPAPTCFNFCPEESQKQSPGSGKAPEWPFQPSRKNLHGLGWLGCRRDISHPMLGRGLGS